jgi:hypothetical protein
VDGGEGGRVRGLGFGVWWIGWCWVWFWLGARLAAVDSSLLCVASLCFAPCGSTGTEY